MRRDGIAGVARRPGTGAFCAEELPDGITTENRCPSGSLTVPLFVTEIINGSIDFLVPFINIFFFILPDCEPLLTSLCVTNLHRRKEEAARACVPVTGTPFLPCRHLIGQPTSPRHGTPASPAMGRVTFNTDASLLRCFLISLTAHGSIPDPSLSHPLFHWYKMRAISTEHYGYKRVQVMTV